MLCIKTTFRSIPGIKVGYKGIISFLKNGITQCVAGTSNTTGNTLIVRFYSPNGLTAKLLKQSYRIIKFENNFRN